MKEKLLLLILIFFRTSTYCPAQTFQKTYGGAGSDIGYQVQQTSDGGYIIAGSTKSFGAGEENIYLIKMNASGDTLWTRTYGDTTSGSLVSAWSVQQKNDGGYILVAQSDPSDHSHPPIMYVITINAKDSILWQKFFYGRFAYSVQQASDGNIILAGSAMESGTRGYDAYLLKLSAIGDTMWARLYGGKNDDFIYSMQQTSDGGYILAGTTLSFGSGDFDVYLVKTNAVGDTLWTKAFGGTGDDRSYSIQQTKDGGYIIAGITNSFTGFTPDVYLIKTDTAGKLLWSKYFGSTSGYDYAFSVMQTKEGGYIIAGYSQTLGIYKDDAYLIKTDTVGNLIWSKTYGGTDTESAYSVLQTNDGGYLLLGQTKSFGSGNSDIYLIKTDSLGNSNCNENNAATIVKAASTFMLIPYDTVFSSSKKTYNSEFVVGNGSFVATLCEPIGIQEKSDDQEIVIFPNPSTGNFNVISSLNIGFGILEIVNVVGEKVFEVRIEGVFNKKINLINRPSGIYIVKIHGQEIQYAGKIVIQ